MPIAVACQCGAKFAAKDELAGKAVKCPKCSQPLRIPAAEGAAKPSAAAKTPTKAPEPPVDNSVSNILDEFGIGKTVVGNKCPSCQAAMAEGAVICIQCGYNTKTNKKLVRQADSDATKRRDEIYAGQAARAAAMKPRSGAGSGGSGGSYAAERPEATLTTLEILFCIFCNTIALIVGVIYLVTGNPKGPAMLKVSGIVLLVAVVIRVVATVVALSVPGQ